MSHQTVVLPGFPKELTSQTSVISYCPELVGTSEMFCIWETGIELNDQKRFIYFTFRINTVIFLQTHLPGKKKPTNTQLRTWQQSWIAAFGHWALTTVASLSNLWYLLVQLFPTPSEGQKSRAAATMKILKTVILVFSNAHRLLLQ